MKEQSHAELCFTIFKKVWFALSSLLNTSFQNLPLLGQMHANWRSTTMYVAGCFHRLGTGPVVLLIISFCYQVCQNIGLTEHQTQSLVSKIGDQEIKDKLKETTQKALDMGVSTWNNLQTILSCFKLAICLCDAWFIQKSWANLKPSPAVMQHCALAKCSVTEKRPELDHFEAKLNPSYKPLPHLWAYLQFWS